ncbi:MAG TPA: efflux RND transporter permease subunit [Candidatus Binataceae bacterium]|nr:efflux RND transporter permease subunit [Candidatus Binataceae bacterium]
MSVSELFIRRPVMTTLLSLAIVIFGAIAYRTLPVSALPNVDFPAILVYASLPGASPETMASSVATPLEKQFSDISGLQSMNSSSYQGTTNITLQFDLNKNIDAAAQDVQSAIVAAQPYLPHEMPSPPTFRKVNPAEQAIMYLGFSSRTLPLSDVDHWAETDLAQRISMVSGVAQVQVYGSKKYAVRIQLDPKLLAAHGIGIDEVSQAVQNANVNLPTGTLYGKHRAFTVQAAGQLTDAAAYRPLIVAFRNGAPVRLGQLGRVLDSVQNDKVGGWVTAEPGVVLAIQRQPGTNTVQVVNDVRKVIDNFRRELPASVKLTILYDRSQSIRASVDDVQFTLMLTVALVVMVIFLFLRNVSATAIPSAALPLSIVGTFAVMAELGYSLDNLSLMAITLSVGFVVDDAIVMLENIFRHMEMGKSALEAALDGSREIGFTILSMTLSLAAVFIPVLFMGGVLGRLLHEFAVTIAVAILVSGFVSLTLTPMLCSRFLRPPKSQHHGRMYQVTERGFDALLAGYKMTLAFVMRHRLATMVVSLGILVATFYLFAVVPKGFLPTEDTGQIVIFTQTAQGISYDAMEQHTRALMNILKADPNIDSFFAGIGGGGPIGSLNNGIMFIHLADHRKLNADQVVEELRPKVSQIPGMLVFIQNPPPLSLSAHFTKAIYQLTLQSPHIKDLYHYAPMLESKMRALKDLTDVNSDLEIKNPQVSIAIDRDKALTMGISAQALEDALYNSYGSRQISTIYAQDDEYWVELELEPKYQADPSTVSLLYIRSADGKMVPLDTFVKMNTNLGPLSVNHNGQIPSVTISFNTAPGASLGKALAEVKTLADNTLPSTITTEFGGAAEQFQSSLGSLGMLLMMAILVIYLVLGILYESFIHPITILSGLPSAGFGALLTLMVFGMQLDLFAFVGIIMLVGLVKKNAIMMIDFALDAQRSEGESAAAAIYEGAVVRFRPIMMTTAAAFMGVLPIAVGLGAGSESRRPLGVAVVGGLFFSQMLTLYITPVFYTYMDTFHNWLVSLWPSHNRIAAAIAAEHAHQEVGQEKEVLIDDESTEGVPRRKRMAS